MGSCFGKNKLKNGIIPYQQRISITMLPEDAIIFIIFKQKVKDVRGIMAILNKTGLNKEIQKNDVLRIISELKNVGKIKQDKYGFYQVNSELCNTKN